MLCCIVAFMLITRFVIGWNEILSIVGLGKQKPPPEYDYTIYCELDRYET